MHMHRYPDALVDRADRRGKETNKVESLGLDKTIKIWNKNPASRRTEQSAGFSFFAGGVWPKHIFDIGFLFGSRIAHAVTTATRGDSLSRISSPSSLGRENFSFLPLSYLPPFLPFPERKSVHIFTSSLISSLIASYGLRVSVLINLPSLLVLVHFYLLPVSAFCIRGVPETASVRRINRKRSYIYRLNGESCQEFYEILLFRNIDWKFFANWKKRRNQGKEFLSWF